ncbi:alpha-galactosidase [Demequina aestuarii]|uniref:alpha-galactosidase n=1 Tax=Demequina aestuarii TaxID=327095 RepID=UPI000A02DE05|nr:alpha-galactosidase [Demequina aestuarii]
MTTPDTPVHATPKPPHPSLVHLSNGGVDLVLACHDHALPEVLHWGGPLHGAVDDALATASAHGVGPSALDEPWPLTLAPTDTDGWAGRPGFALHRHGLAVLPRWERIDVDHDAHRIDVRAESSDVALMISLRIDLAGVVWWQARIENLGDDDLDVAALEAALPVPDGVDEVLDFSGRWTRERAPQRAPLREGTRVRETRRGRTGHDSPMVTVLGRSGFDASHGEVWAVHAAWSADAVYRVDALPESPPVLGAGALLRPGEISLPPGASHSSPEVAFVWSSEGLDGLATRLHCAVRARSRAPHPRPVTLNTWEAVYFQHDTQRLTKLADVASSVGVERFVLDDGWFRGRRSDASSLGDWTVDGDVWPDGLHPLVDHVRGLGMQFGLWFEPEMVSPDSDLARSRPEWLLGHRGESERTWRGQHALDLANSDVSQYLLDSITALVEEYSLDYIKWDHNRDLLVSVHAGRHGTVAQTVAAYGLIDALRARFPTLEIESCASGGARVDLGILSRTDRIWPSDTNDPLERLEIQRWTELLVPPEMIGAHVGPDVAHTTQRHSALSLRIATALTGAMGIEWDLTTCSDEELDELRAGISAHVRLRPLLHSGTVAHPPTAEPGLRLTTVTSHDRRSAVVRLVRVASDGRSLPAMLRVPGLEPHRTYAVRPVEELRSPRYPDLKPPPWLRDGAVRLTGSALAHVGVRPPSLDPGQAFVIEIHADGTT